jgi:hypothetical protein
MRATCEISDRTRRGRRIATSLVGARHVAADALARDELGDRAPLGSTQSRTLRSHGAGHQRFDDRLRRSRAKRIQHRCSRIRGAVMTVRAARRKNLRAIRRLRESWRTGEKNGEERYKFHEMKRAAFTCRTRVCGVR